MTSNSIPRDAAENALLELVEGEMVAGRRLEAWSGVVEDVSSYGVRLLVWSMPVSEAKTVRVLVQLVASTPDEDGGSVRHLPLDFLARLTKGTALEVAGRIQDHFQSSYFAELLQTNPGSYNLSIGLIPEAYRLQNEPKSADTMESEAASLTALRREMKELTDRTSGLMRRISVEERRKDRDLAVDSLGRATLSTLRTILTRLPKSAGPAPLPKLPGAEDAPPVGLQGIAYALDEVSTELSWAVTAGSRTEGGGVPPLREIEGYRRQVAAHLKRLEELEAAR